MALSELSAIEAAYQALQPLDDAGRRRALRWLSDALGGEDLLAATTADTATRALAAQLSAAQLSAAQSTTPTETAASR